MGKMKIRLASCRQINMKNKSLGILPFFKVVSCAAVQTTCGHEVVLQEAIGRCTTCGRSHGNKYTCHVTDRLPAVEKRG